MTTTTIVETPTRLASRDRRTDRRSLAAASVGNVLEWFDWTVYATFAPLFAQQFFPPGSRTAQLLSALAVFAVGFLMRPLGGWLFGTFADRSGRRAALTVSIVLMGGGSALIAISPTYADIGIAAALILLIARMVQGLSLGGEFGTSATYLAERAPRERRGLFSSVYYMGTAAGLLLASGLSVALHSTLSTQDMRDWGWRIAFALGAFGALAGYWIRRRAAETQQFQTQRMRRGAAERPLLAAIRSHPKEIGRIVAFTIAATLAFYIFATYFPTYVASTTGLSPALASLANTIALVVFLVLQPVFGALSDRIGRKPLLLVFAGGFAIGAVPAAIALSASFPVVLTIELIALALFGLYSAIAPAVMAEQFPTNVRAVAIGAPYNLVVALFGGTAPYLLTWLRSENAELVFFGYLAVAAVIGAVAFLTMPETKGKELS
jgi:MHS family alpha-ketoglutarate permease-like MFS transporter